MHLTSHQLGHLLHLTRHEPRRIAKRYLKDLGGDGSADELDRVLAEAEQDGAAIAEAGRLDAVRHASLQVVEQSTADELAAMMLNVRLEMERQGLAVSDLAARCNLSPERLSAYLAGEKEPPTANLVKLATALGCAWRLKAAD